MSVGSSHGRQSWLKPSGTGATKGFLGEPKDVSVLQAGEREDSPHLYHKNQGLPFSQAVSLSPVIAQRADGVAGEYHQGHQEGQGDLASAAGLAELGDTLTFGL